jgi:phage gp36-like protein
VPYATQSDLVTRFGSAELAQLTDRVAGTTIDAAVVSAALADADALIDGYLARRYALPVAPTPALLLRLAGDIARFLLHGTSASDKVRAAYDDALRMLRDLADGRAALPGALPAPAAQNPASGSPASAAPERVFSRTTMADYLG